LAPGQTARITYSVEVQSPSSQGNQRLRNTIVTPDRTNCHTGSADPDCTVVVLVPNIHYDKVRVGVGPVTSGDVVTYRVTVENTGQAAGAASFTDDLSAVLDDAIYGGDEKVVSGPGSVSYSAPNLSYSAGSLDPGQKAVITYSVTIKQAQGDHVLTNRVVSPPNTN